MKILIPRTGGIPGGAKCMDLWAEGLALAGADVYAPGPRPFFPDFHYNLNSIEDYDWGLFTSDFWKQARRPRGALFLGPPFRISDLDSVREKAPWDFVAVNARFYVHQIEKVAGRRVDLILPSPVHPLFKDYKFHRKYDVGLVYWPRNYKPQTRDREILRELSSSLKVAVVGHDPKVPKVQFLGLLVDFRRLIEVYNQTKVWLVTNLWEGDSTTTAEAVACGCHVVALESFWTNDIEKRFPKNFHVFPLQTPSLEEYQALLNAGETFYEVELNALRNLDIVGLKKFIEQVLELDPHPGMWFSISDLGRLVIRKLKEVK